MKAVKAVEKERVEEWGSKNKKVEMKKYTGQENLIQEAANTGKKYKIVTKLGDDFNLLNSIVGKLDKEPIEKVIDGLIKSLEELKKTL